MIVGYECGVCKEILIVSAGEVLLKLLSVFGVAFVSFWAAIPTGLAMGLSPVLVAATAVVSYASGVGIVAVLGKPIRDRIMQRFGGKLSTNQDSFVHRAWRRFGVVGLALLAPITTGAQIGAILGLSLGVSARRLWIAMSLGAVLWAVLLTAAVVLGILGARSLT
jgi:Ca2+/H+ antiporter, TMEM165/GDT1 family